MAKKWENLTKEEQEDIKQTFRKQKEEKELRELYGDQENRNI